MTPGRFPMLRLVAGVLACVFVSASFGQDDAVIVTATRFADSKRNLPVRHGHHLDDLTRARPRICRNPRAVRPASATRPAPLNQQIDCAASASLATEHAIRWTVCAVGERLVSAQPNTISDSIGASRWWRAAAPCFMAAATPSTSSPSGRKPAAAARCSAAGAGGGRLRHARRRRLPR